MKIALSGFYGAGNTGDEAILEAIIDNLNDSLESPEITVLSLNPQETSKRHKVKAVYRAWRRENREKWQVLREADVLISGGGGLLQDTYPTKVIFGPLPYYLLIVFLAKLARTKVMFFSQGIGPVNTNYGKWLMRRFANMADLITVRDSHSKNLLQSLKVTKPETIVTADIVFAFKRKTDNSCFLSLPEKWKNYKDSLVAVSVRPWFGSDDYYDKIADSLDSLIKSDDVYPVFVPMEGIHDIRASKEVIRRMQFGKQCTILDGEFTPNQYLNFIAETKLLIGMRLHALIFATICHVPHIGISYDPKVESLLKRNGLWDYSFLLEDIDSNQLAENAHSILNNTAEARANLKVSAESLRKEALRNIELLKENFH
ncbi:polysaccharide pyruvyl transferase CsaB [Aquibacillus rhizosphaerae]|uniref:Polysaccharide pyruvyl transferase CsaB n=1 Tax=Aquibacillus rhizosphaerae TaxID=3051431 RepID=A0ABT7KZE0_9BACI|nr:polysaccharide pyruvyl transferase CsaB [Aquibacillus sp. LR5S19]MDL4838886.1 polysaccharide pyruvyl transferase CsaB [Aquibacillus sp. LR5S19]